MLCPKCGQQNLDDARFCKNCGAPLEAAPPTPPPTAAAPGRSPLEGLGSPSETMPAAQTSFTASTPKTPEKKTEPTTAAPPPPPPVTAPVEKKADTSPPAAPAGEKSEDVSPPPPPTAPVVESKTVDSAPPPPPPPTAEPVPAGAAKSQKKPLLVCASIVGIVFLLFMMLVLAAMCIGNTATSRLSGPGDSYVFTVDVSEPVQVTFEVPEDAQFNVSITGPQGDLVGDWNINPYNNVFMLQRIGTYTFTVYSVGGSGWWKAKW